MDYSAAEQFGLGMFALVSTAGMLLLYFIPALIGYIRHRRHNHAILVLNLLTGWTFIGWVGALIWAMVGPNRGPAPEPAAR